MKQLDKLLFEQGDRCFFCKKNLAKADASVEHLLAQANGGTNVDENVVACCKTLNALLGSKSLKEKIQIVLRQNGAFVCPADKAAQLPKTEQATPKPVGAPNPKGKATQAKSSSTSVPNVVDFSSQAKAQMNSAETGSAKCPTCRSSVAKAAGQTGYQCGKCGTAFQY